MFKAEWLSRAAVFSMLVSLSGLTPEDGGFFILRNTIYLSVDYTALYPTGWDTS
jgi:hypothetical protein